MNVLMVGSGKGSWTMRGEQLGAAIGARTTSLPTDTDWRWADVAVLIKRAGMAWARHARAAGVPIVWDALDFWRQPAENGYSEKEARQLLGAHLAEIRPVLTIAATQAMATACDGVYLPHHSWAGLETAPARERVDVVAYEGNPVYLGAWGQRLQQACAARGWRFVVNPPDLRDVDILVAFRDGPWDGFMCRAWKSGVKLSNAIAAGKPVIGQASAALTEMAPPSTVIDRPEQLEDALDAWAPHAARAAAVEVCRLQAPSFRLPSIADQFRDALQQVEARCAA